MAKDKTQRKPRAETPPKGFRDYFGTDVTERKAMLDTIAEVYHRHGFDPLETSAVETVEALGKFLPDVDRPNAGVFGWQEESESGKEGDWLALRYDLTAPLARVAAQFRNDLPRLIAAMRWGRSGATRSPARGGSASLSMRCGYGRRTFCRGRCEICAMLSDALEAVGIDRADYIVRVNNRKVLNGVMEVAGVLDPSDPSKWEDERGIVLRAIDKLDRLGEEGVRALLGAGGREDASGDFTKGAGLSPEQAEIVMGFMSAKRATGGALTAARLRELAGGASATGGLKACKSWKPSQSFWRRRATAPTGSTLILPSCAALAITPAPYSRLS